VRDGPWRNVRHPAAWAGNFLRALGYVDTAVNFRNTLRPGSSGAT